jgi:cystathionine gamma-synthase
VVVAAGRGAAGPGDPVNVPVHLSSTYRDGGDLSYGRESNATWAAAEEVIGRLEGGTALLFASGMAAVSAVVETLPAGATVVVPEDAYNGTRRLLADLATRGRLSFRPIDPTDAASAGAACAGAALLWLESPSNPMMRVCDLVALAAAGHRCGAVVAVDNTFATPLLQQPLGLGADVVVHSATKLLAGHSEVVMGAAVTAPGRPDLAAALADRRLLHGAVPGPLEAFLTLSGLRTLAVRVERAQANAGELASRLDAHPAVARVLYPGLPSHPGHQLARRQMAGFGSILSFVVAAGAAAADAVCSSVRLCVPATSLGGVETLIERRARYEGEDLTPPGLLRLSVGIEDVDDIWADLEAALAHGG